MHIEFTSFSQFMAMGGYAKFVWSAYGVVFCVLLGNVFYTLMKRKQPSEETINE